MAAYLPPGEEISKMSDEEVLHWCRFILRSSIPMQQDIEKLASRMSANWEKDLLQCFKK